LEMPRTGCYAGRTLKDACLKMVEAAKGFGL